ncbi:PucR family transcriptional regulator [Xylanimonas allomyrinae]|uniref:PucR family transcriptional regulator n=1 Tax=Xylanimonas allomyrinae TaxID=2509459 RepID=A0A4P6ELE5_9MICO|nr:PucR family transcriptional regulator [Xylanimonas allomyrinae]QAY63076.1 PucR family transcriptional regulator [Xylanimonas allomyrinae]
MSDRPGSRTVRTDRPAPGDSHLLPSVRDVLASEPVARALPELVCGAEGLDAPVRWVHVAETPEAAGLVSGGELLLSTGIAWPADGPALHRLGRQLVAARIAGLVLELGDHLPAAPPALVAELRAAGVPFVVLHRKARFVDVTESVHARIISDQTAALRARDEIHTLFTGLSLRGSPADVIVAHAARVLACPVVLEDAAHQVVAAENLSPDGADLAAWEQRSRAAHRGTGQDGWTIAPVEARGTRWGHLVALPGEQHRAGRSTVLEQAAVALTLSRLADRDDDAWSRHSHTALLGTLLRGRHAGDGELTARFEASGFPVTGRVLTGAVLLRRAGALDDGAATRVVRAARASGLGVLAAPQPDRPGRLVVAVSARDGHAPDDAAFQALAAAAPHEADERAADVVVGTGAHGPAGLLASLTEAVALAGRLTPGPAAAVHRASRHPLLRLVTALGGDPRLTAHAEDLLRPLVEHDLAHDGDLVEVLRAYVAHPGNRTRAAAASHLSRSVFYQRLALVSRLLGLDLDDGEAVAALHVAVLARPPRRA